MLSDGGWKFLCEDGEELCVQYSKYGVVFRSKMEACRRMERFASLDFRLISLDSLDRMSPSSVECTMTRAFGGVR